MPDSNRHGTHDGKDRIQIPSPFSSSLTSKLVFLNCKIKKRIASTPTTKVGLEQKMRKRLNVWEPPEISRRPSNVRAFLPLLFPRVSGNSNS